MIAVRGGRRLAALGLAAVLLLAVRQGGAASIAVGPGQTYELTADVELTMDDTFVAQGTADAPCIIEGHTFQVRAKNIRGSVAIIHCTVHQVGDRGKAAFDLELHGAGALRIEDSTFTQTGPLYVVAEDHADVSLLRNHFQADSPAAYRFKDMLASAP